MASISTRRRKDGSTSWVVRIKYTHHGEQRVESRTFSSKQYRRRDAAAWAARREEAIQAGQLARLEDRQVTLAMLTQRYIEEYEEVAAWGKTKANDLRHLQGYDIAQRPVAALTAQDYIAHIRHRRATGAGAATANNDLIWWRIILKMAAGAWNAPVSTEALDSAAMVLRAHKVVSRSRRRTRRPTRQELDALLAHFADQDGRAQIPMVDLVLFQLFSARRIAETCRLRWADTDLAARRVLVRDMKDPRRKTGNDTWVTLTRQAAAILDRQPRGGERVFPYDSKSVGAAFRRGCKMVGIDDLRLHDLRHEATSWLFEAGLDIPRVAQVTGHKSWGSLQRYAHLEGTEAKDKYAHWRWLRHRNPGRLRAVQ
jgi:integrase